MYRQVLQSDLDIIVHKSTALAAQNFMISMAANNYDTCPMEGFDSKSVKAILGLPPSAMITMVISCGIRGKGGVYGPQFRVPFNQVYFEK
jgi:nitroreductase